MSQSENLWELYRAGRDGATGSGIAWEGSFEEYLRLLGRDPRPARNAWQRLLAMVESHGSELLPDGTRRWLLFQDPLGEGREAVSGLDRPLAELVDTLRAGARHLGPERRMLLLHGPVGSAKSTIARLLKRGLEAFSRTAAGAVYTFEWHVDGDVYPSPLRQDPLLLVPGPRRSDLAKALTDQLGAEYELRIEGELDPLSRYWWETLLERHGGDEARVLEHVRVRRICFSEANRIGVGTFQPKDEKNQDSTELTGDLNYRKIAEYGSDSDPRAFNFDGEFCIANRGLLEFVEVLKLDVAFLYDLLGATQEHVIKPKKFQQVSIDQVILGHTNEPEFRRLQANELMEAFRDRTIRIDIPYNLEVSSELEIHRARYGQRGAPGRGLAPHTLEMASLWAILTRIEEPEHAGLDLLQKALLYDGQEVQGFQAEQVTSLREASEREGMEGVSPRFIQDRIASVLVSERETVGPRDLLDAIEQALRHHSMVASKDLRKSWIERLELVRQAYAERLQHEVRSAIAADEGELDRLCARYLDGVRAYTAPESHGSAGRGDERLMRSVEEKIDISEGRKDDFRHELMNYIAVVHLEGEVFDYRENDRLRRALELKLFEDHRDSIQLISLVSSVVDPQTEERLASLRSRLMERFGYDELGAQRVLEEVAHLFAHPAQEPPAEEHDQAA